MNETVTRAEYEELKHRVEAAEDRLHNGDVTLALLRQRLDQIETKLDEVAVAIQDLRMKPAKRWDSVSGQVVNWLIALLLGVVAVKLGVN